MTDMARVLASRLTLRSDHWTLEVLPGLGASVLNLRSAAGRPVLRPVAAEHVQTSSQCASFALLPYSNRIRDARFVFGGQAVQLQVNTKDGLAQHGDVRNRPWQVVAQSDTRLACAFDSRDFADINWPWAFTARTEYVLDGPTFSTHLTLTNADTREMPAGMGLHPYFARRHGGVDPQLSFGSGLAYDSDERQLPTAQARPVRPDEDYRQPSAVGERRIDRGYAAWDGAARLDWGTRALSLHADPLYSHLIVFTAPDGSLALEPVTHATDAFNLAEQGVPGVDRRVLAPGQSLSATFRVTLEGDWSLADAAPGAAP